MRCHSVFPFDVEITAGPVLNDVKVAVRLSMSLNLEISPQWLKFIRQRYQQGSVLFGIARMRGC